MVDGFDLPVLCRMKIRQVAHYLWFLPNSCLGQHVWQAIRKMFASFRIVYLTDTVLIR
jgi:hypothetical protein